MSVKLDHPYSSDTFSSTKRRNNAGNSPISVPTPLQCTNDTDIEIDPLVQDLSFMVDGEEFPTHTNAVCEITARLHNAIEDVGCENSPHVHYDRFDKGDFDPTMALRIVDDLENKCSLLNVSMSSIVDADDSFTAESDSDESESGKTIDDSEGEHEKDFLGDRKFIVFESCLDILFKRCSECGEIVTEVSRSTNGSMLTVKMTCIRSHNVIWRSQPIINRMSVGNLLMAAAILFSGNTFNRIAQCFSFLNLTFFSEVTYLSTQNRYLFPVINTAWERESTQVKADLRNMETVKLSGDGRCDSPGYSAKYGLYSFIEQSSEKVVDFTVTQVSQVANSNAMEKAGFKKTLDRILTDEVKVSTVATDRHLQIANTMKKDYPEISHQFDVWHVAKSITKRLTEYTKRKKYKDLKPWVQSVSNHLWWSAATCDGNPDILREKWLSIVHHTANVHDWDGCTHFHGCAHPPLERDDEKAIKWLKIGEPSHDVLKEVVFDKKIQAAAEKLSEFCHTGSLESFHALLTKYCPKRQHFSYKGMVARAQLAALDHNANSGRNHASITNGDRQGEHRYRTVFPKNRKAWVAKPIKEKKSYCHVSEMMCDVIGRRRSGREDGNINVPDLPANIAPTPRPPVEDVVTAHLTRFRQ
ncbi:uncharacterized protein [Ptychodera flava]|uniref:uncharacterized protein n=1 Tax=Ptychodera flava TaxID=63121 RepID=UPI00396A2DDE